MLVFTKGDWMMSLVFCAIFAVIVWVPCIIIAIMGRKMIIRIGQSPSQTPAIQLGVFSAVGCIGSIYICVPYSVFIMSSRVPK